MSGIVNTLSTYYASIRSRRLVADLSQKLARAGREASTGLREDVHRSLGRSAASQATELHASLQRVEGFITSNQMLADRMGTTATALGAIRASAQEVLDLAAPNKDSAVLTAGALQAAAKAALQEIMPMANTTYSGIALFAGVDSGETPLAAWDKVNDATGLAPQDVIDAIVAGGPASAADATAKADALKDIFGSADPADPRRFEATFFRGTPLKDAGGNDNPRVSARIDDEAKMTHGVQANDPAFTETLRGLAMIASTDVSKITDPDAYKAWMNSAVDALSGGVGKMLTAESRLGAQQNTLERMMQNQQSRVDLYNSRILDIEGVDPYEAATRVTNLQNQLEASYAVTARLSKLSYLNFMR